MASTSQGASGPVKTVGQEFWEHRGINQRRVPNGPLKRPLYMEEYVQNNPMCQTDICTMVAVEQHNSKLKDGERCIRNPVGTHSNMFLLSRDDPFNYFHLYFDERIGEKTVRSYFAELKGRQGPEILITCRAVNKATGTVLNCRHCFGGILHPLDGGFTGHMQEASR